MTKEGSEEVEGLLGYDPKTAGGIMVVDFIALNQETTAKEAVEALQKEYIDIEMPFYLYLVDDFGYLRGVVSLRQLVVVPPATQLKSIPFVTTFTDILSVFFYFKIATLLLHL